MLLVHLQHHGHQPIALLGGATGMIGDPSGKAAERVLMSADEVNSNLESIKVQLMPLLDFERREKPALIVNNADWLGGFELLSFLRDIGKHFNVTDMMDRASVKQRLERGLSFTEFSYQVLQAYDFMWLYDQSGCRLQVGGSDQWGNITAGIDLIRRLRGAEAPRAEGLVCPLITSESGEKFGKTESGAVWLDPRRTSPYEFFQFWYSTRDVDVVQYLKFFTLLDQTDIASLEETLTNRPSEREPHEALAREVTRMIHGDNELARVVAIRNALFGKESTASIDVLRGAALASFARDEILAGVRVIDVLTKAMIAQSNGEARRLIQQGGIYLGSKRVTDPAAALGLDEALGGEVFVVRRGTQPFVIRID